MYYTCMCLCVCDIYVYIYIYITEKVFDKTCNVCVCERESIYVCVWERVCVCVWEREYICVCVRESMCVCVCVCVYIYILGVDRLSAPILSILPIIDIGHFQNRFADNFFFLCKQTYYLQVTLFIGE